MHKLMIEMFSRANVRIHCKLCRYLSTAEVSTALRPFYFSVHPDLFGKFPKQRTVNENSMKQLSALLEAQQANRRLTVPPLPFYLRNKKSLDGEFKLVTVCISGNDVRETITKILTACELTTEYVDKIPKSRVDGKTRHKATDPFAASDQKYRDEYDLAAQLEKEIETSKVYVNIIDWINQNSQDARKKYELTKATREQVDTLQVLLRDKFGVKDVKWESGWNVSHIRGALQSLVSLATQNTAHMDNLKGRTFALGQFTGVSLEGDIFLSIVEVRHNWIEVIKNLHAQDVAVTAIPQYENTLSQILREIHISRRKFMPKLSAVDYCSHLRRLTTSLGDFYGSGRKIPPSVPASLSRYEMVVEPEAGPLMLSPTGQFITPSSCPAAELIGFIAARLDEAVQLLTEYNINKHVERALHQEVVARFQLLDLQKDDSITPALMIHCLQNLLNNIEHIGTKLKGNILYITNYYSVLSDGVLCIPWNFK